MNDLADGATGNVVLKAIVCLAGFVAKEILTDEDKPHYVEHLASVILDKPLNREGVN